MQVFHVLALSSGEGVWCKLVHHPLGSVQDPPTGMAWVSMWVTGCLRCTLDNQRCGRLCCHWYAQHAQGINDSLDRTSQKPSRRRNQVFGTGSQHAYKHATWVGVQREAQEDTRRRRASANRSGLTHAGNNRHGFTQVNIDKRRLAGTG